MMATATSRALERSLMTNREMQQRRAERMAVVSLLVSTVAAAFSQNAHVHIQTTPLARRVIVLNTFKFCMRCTLKA